MRILTLDEKISIKGLLARKGLELPRLDTLSAVFFWGMVYGSSVANWHRVLVKIGNKRAK